MPYGSLVPQDLDGVLGAGRHIACDASSHSFLREVPQCWLTGHAAGVAATLAVAAAIEPRQLDPQLIQRELLRQDAYLSPTIEKAVKQGIADAVTDDRAKKSSLSTA